MYLAISNECGEWSLGLLSWVRREGGWEDSESGCQITADCNEAAQMDIYALATMPGSEDLQAKDTLVGAGELRVGSVCFLSFFFSSGRPGNHEARGAHTERHSERNCFFLGSCWHIHC